MNFISFYVSALLAQPVQKTVSLSLSMINTHLKVNHQLHILFIFSLFFVLENVEVVLRWSPKIPYCLKADDNTTLKQVAFFLESSIQSPHPHLAQICRFYDNFTGSYNWKEYPTITRNLLQTYDNPVFKSY